MYVVDVIKNVNGIDKIEKKVFLHMIKTAGISVHQAINKSQYRIQFNQRHSHISMLPDKYIDLPRHIILRKPEDWYISFYNFFLPVEGFFSFMLRDDEGIPIDINEFILRASNMKDFFFQHQFKTAILNSILNEQETLHFMFTFFTEQITEETYINYNFSLFDWFWRGTGGDNATIYPMCKKGLDNLSQEFNIKIGHNNKTDIPDDYKELLPVKKGDISPEMLKLIQQTDKKYYDKFEELVKN